MDAIVLALRKINEHAQTDWLAGETDVVVTPSGETPDSRPTLARKDKIGFVVLWLFSILFITGGLFFLSFGSKELIHGYSSKSWPQTRGVVTSSEVSTGFGRSPSGGQNTLFYAMISYDYRVSGNVYSGSRVSFGHYSHDAADAQSIVSQYPKGRKINVSYAPGDPSLAVLEPGCSAGMWGPMVGGIVFLAVGSLCFALLRFLRQYYHPPLNSDQAVKGQSQSHQRGQPV
jgi:hypothetical protein